ncbi:hypothetical protein [Gallaecimonas mangrovi]|uniref:hypothetical protein n=1 Tax=Gallaecimonas mangrovi TaxID=2291597 RepID=UPI000E203005|nr:hypothetical protein [Gallaecimonas mangrovi]
MYQQPWADINDFPASHGSALAAELKQELAASHRLDGVSFSVLAKREDCDEVLIGTAAGYFIVHLTWSAPDPKGEFPKTKWFADAHALQQQLAADAAYF